MRAALTSSRLSLCPDGLVILANSVIRLGCRFRLYPESLDETGFSRVAASSADEIIDGG